MTPNTQIPVGRPNVPLPIRWVNRLARAAGSAFDRLTSLKKEHLCEAVERHTGLKDWGDSGVEAALDMLLEAVIHEGRLTFFGRFTLRQFLIDNLSSRLRVIEVLKRWPAIRQQHILKPIVITGWYRSGTTYLHNLLAAHPDVRVPLFWELRHPCPGLEPRFFDPRRQVRKVQRERRIHRWLAPDFNAIHPMAAEKPEECLHLFEKACAGTTAFVITEAKSLAWQLLDDGIEHAYEFFKFQLQLLNWLRPGRQWVLKWPYHLWHLDSLLKTFPDAAVIQLHRDPRRAIPSVCSLAAAARAPFCENIDTDALGRFWLDYYGAGLHRSLRARKKAAANQIFDVCYADLIQNPLSVLKQIKRKFILAESDTWRDSMSTTLSVKKQDRHRYAMDQFGLDSEKIRQRFASYIADYDLSPEAEHQR